MAAIMASFQPFAAGTYWATLSITPIIITITAMVRRVVAAARAALTT